MARNLVKATEGISKPIMDGERHIRRMLIRASTVALVVAVVSACSSAEPPSQLPVPEVTWPDNAMAHGLEDSPWVQIVREAEVLSSVAWNYLDYSDPDLISTWGYETVVDEMVRDAELRFVPSLYSSTSDFPSLLDWGPNPIVPVKVDETEGGAIVTACAVFSRNAVDGEVRAVELRSYEIRDVEGGTTITYETSDQSVEDLGFPECGPDRIEGAFFAPPPELPPSPENGIKYPADRKVYEELQTGGG